MDSIADQLKAEMKAIGAVEISLEQADAVARVVLRNYPQVEGGKAPNPNPKWVGRDAALIAKAAGIETVVFDRGGYVYHGRVQALAEGAREGGLQF